MPLQPSAKKYSLTFLISIPRVSFSCFIDPAKTSNTTLNKCGNSEPWFFFIFVKVLCNSISVDVAYVFAVNCLYYIEVYPCNSNLGMTFKQLYRILLKTCSGSGSRVYCRILFQFICVVIYIYWLYIETH